MSTIDVKVPDIGDFKDIPVIEVFVKPGDTVKADDSLVTLESDKATMDVPSPAAGVVRELKLKVGDKVSEGTLVLVLEAAAAGACRCAGTGERALTPALSRKRERERGGAGGRAGARCGADPPRRSIRASRERPRRSTAKRSRPRTRRRRCASSRANSASTWRA